MNVIISGCNGTMGKVLVNVLSNKEDVQIVAGFDSYPDQFEHPFPVYKSPSDCTKDADVVIDFSHHSLISGILDYCVATNTPLVIATTGFNEEDYKRMEEASKSIPLFHSGNMSLGINVLTELSKKAAQVFEDTFDIEIIEKHHNLKVDSPSGTAYLIANGINEVFDPKKEFVYGRHSREDLRSTKDIGIHAIRGGTIVGEHTVIFAGNDEIVEIKHTASSKKIFAVGALKAAKFLINQKNGFYNMNDMLQ